MLALLSAGFFAERAFEKRNQSQTDTKPTTYLDSDSRTITEQ